MNCEIHLTFGLELEEKVQAAAKGLGWKFSKILNDPVLGDKPFCYLSTYAPDASRALSVISQTRTILFLEYALVPLREKIEVIIYDWKFNLKEPS